MEDELASMTTSGLLQELTRRFVVVAGLVPEWEVAGELLAELQKRRWRISIETVDGPGHRWRCTIYSSTTPNWEVAAVRSNAIDAIFEAAIRAESSSNRSNDDE